MHQNITRRTGQVPLACARLLNGVGRRLLGAQGAMRLALKYPEVFRAMVWKGVLGHQLGWDIQEGQVMLREGRARAMVELAISYVV